MLDINDAKLLDEIRKLGADYAEAKFRQFKYSGFEEGMASEELEEKLIEFRALTKKFHEAGEKLDNAIYDSSEGDI